MTGRIKVNRVLKVLVCFLILICIYPSMLSANPITGYEGFYLSPYDLSKLETMGLSGDSRSADRIFQYYLAAENSVAMKNWAFISAQNGEADGQLNYAKLIANSPDTDSQLRAIYWTQLALKNKKENFPDADEFLSELKTAMAHTGPLCDQIGLGSNLNTDQFDDSGDVLSHIQSLSFENIMALRVRALCGDAEAGRALVIYYGLSSSLSQLNYFINIGAEDGDARSEFDLAKILEDGSAKDKIRAVFWANRALTGKVSPSMVTEIQSFLKENMNQ